jgi:hypothetical protein
LLSTDRFQRPLYLLKMDSVQVVAAGGVEQAFGDIGVTANSDI